MRLLQTYILYFCNNLSIGNLKENLMVYMVWDITVNLLYSDFFYLIYPIIHLRSTIHHRQFAVSIYKKSLIKMRLFD